MARMPLRRIDANGYTDGTYGLEVAGGLVTGLTEIDPAGTFNFGDLLDVDLTGAAEGDFVQLNSGFWVPVDAPAGGGGGGSSLVVQNKTADYNAVANELVLMDPTSGARTVTLPSTHSTGDRVGVLQRITNANYVNVVPSGIDKINEVYSSARLNSAFDYVEMVWNGTHWYVIAGRGNVSFSYAHYVAQTPLLWLQANDKVWTDTGGTVPGSGTGDAIAAWGDAMESRLASQGTASARPLLRKAEYNGQDTLRFDGSDDQLILAATTSILVTNPVIFWVLKPTSSANRMTISLSHTASGWATPFHRWGLYQNGTYRSNWNGVDRGNVGTWGTGTLQVISWKDGDIWDGTTKVVDAADADMTYPNGVTPMLISGNGVGSERFAGDISEILIYDNLSETDRATVVAALKSKYGL